MFNFGGFRKSKFGIVMLVFFASQTMASSGTISITGQIYEASCRVTAVSKSISLDEILKSSIVSVGAFGEKRHSIVIENCPGNVTPEFTFSTSNSSQIHESSIGLLSNSEVSDPATGVYVQLQDSNGRPINLASFSQELEEGENTINITTAYYAEDSAKVTAGGVSSSINYQINYN